MLGPFFINPKIYNQKVHDYIAETNKRYLRNLNERSEYNNKYAILNSVIKTVDKQSDKQSDKQNDKTNKYQLNNAQIFCSISGIFLVSTFMFYVYNLRK
jgi:hypothetical protein